MSWQSDLKKQARELADYTHEIEGKLRFAEKRLSHVATGLYFTDEVESTWTAETKTKVTAAQGLAKLSAMPCRRRPMTYLF